MKPIRLLRRVLFLSMACGASAAIADDAAPPRFTPTVQASLAVQDDVSRELGRSAGHNPAAPASWSALGLNANRMVFSLKADLSRRTSMVYERAGMTSSAEPVLAGLPARPATRMGVEFRPASLKNAMPLGAFRFQMSGNSTLLLKPRSGGASVSWRSQF